MHIVLVGLNHRSASIDVRERLAFSREQLPQAFAKLRDEVGLHEAAILSTCNRVEIYARVAELPRAFGRLHRFLSEHSGVELPGLSERLYSCAEPESVRHLFSVTSGLDSMVLGEAEILHQVKHAYESAKDHGATGKVLNVLFQRALNTAKAVRTQTGIGRGCTSVGTVAVELAEKIFRSLPMTTVLLIGAGKIGELTLRQLVLRGVRELRIMNRSTERAMGLAEAYQAVPVTLSDLHQQLLSVDIVISSAAAPGALLRSQDVAAAMPGRQRRPLCLIDLGVPRNIDPAAGHLENVYLFDIDDLEGLVEHYHRERQQAMCQSQVIIDKKVERFLSWWQEEGVACAPSSLGPAAVR